MRWKGEQRERERGTVYVLTTHFPPLAIITTTTAALQKQEPSNQSNSPKGLSNQPWTLRTN